MSDWHPNQQFDAVYCLNLDRRTDRWRRVQSEFARLEMTVCRFSAVDGNDAEFSDQLATPGASGSRLKSAGEVGCVESYIRLFTAINNSTCDRVLVLEDDVCFHRDFLNRSECLQRLPSQWQLLYLGASQHQWSGVRFWNAEFYQARQSMGTFAFAMRRALFSEFLRQLEERQQPVDSCLAAIQRRHPKSCFVCSPNLVITDVSDSDIRPERSPQAHARLMRWDLHQYRMPLAENPIEQSSDNQLPACPHRRILRGGKARETIQCTHPHVRARENVVTREICTSCEWSGLPSRVTEAASPKPIDWMTAITTAPRQQETLEHCLTSVRSAGWNDPLIFAEPDSTIPADYNNSAVWRQQRLGAFSNWCLALQELFHRNPQADMYLICQDDAVLAQGLRGYLEQHIRQLDHIGVLSPYCPSHYVAAQPPGFHREDRGEHNWGALAYAFPNDSVRSLLCHDTLVNHRLNGPAGGSRHIDSVVGLWCQQTGRAYYVHHPSLVRHIGHLSTIGNADHSGKRRERNWVSDVDLLDTDLSGKMKVS